jgi:hypothetical protein
MGVTKTQQFARGAPPSAAFPRERSRRGILRKQCRTFHISLLSREGEQFLHELFHKAAAARLVQAAFAVRKRSCSGIGVSSSSSRCSVTSRNCKQKATLKFTKRPLSRNAVIRVRFRKGDENPTLIQPEAKTKSLLGSPQQFFLQRAIAEIC